MASIDSALPGHLSTGVFGEGPVAIVLGTFALSVTVWCVVRLVRDRAAVGWPEQIVGLGVGMIAVGVIPFITYGYSPFGAGDRVTVVSTVGGALVWTGALALLRPRRWLVAPVALLLVVSAWSTLLDRQRSYADAGADAISIIRGVEDTIVDPHLPIYIGPEPIVEDNIVAFLDRSNLNGALQYAYRDPTIEVYLTHDSATFFAQPEAQRFDIRLVSRLDD